MRFVLVALVLCVACKDGAPSRDVPSGDAVAKLEEDAAAVQQPKPAPAPEQVVYDFADNAPRAHRYLTGGGLYIDTRDPGFGKYVRFRRGRQWRIGQGGGYAKPSAKRAWLLLGPLPSLETATVEIGVQTSRAQSVSLYSEGRRLATIKTSAGAQVLRAEIELGKRSELGLELRSRGSGLEITHLYVGTVGSSAPTSVEPSRLAAGESVGHSLYLPVGSRLRVKGSIEGCLPWIRATTSSTQVSGQLSSEGFDVGQAGGAVALVSVETRTCASFDVSRLQLTSPTASKDEDATAAPPQPGLAPDYVLFWVMDTLRADRVPIVNPKARAQTPNLQRLADRGVVFRHTYVGGNESQTSHASLWTGTFPGRHGIRSAGDGGRWDISKKLATLGDELSAAGLKVVGVTGNGMVTSSGGFGRGFQKFINLMRENNPDRRNGYIPAKTIVKRALATFEPYRKSRSALFIGTIDTHKPYVGHQPWLDLYHPTPYRGPFKRAAMPRDLGIVRGSMKCAAKISQKDLARILAIYDSDISYQDEHLGLVLDKLEEWGIAERTLVVVTADHGEEMWEDGRCGHGATSRESLVHVPLVMSYPGGLPSGVVVDEGVDGADVLPTVLELLGRPIPETVQGRSLVSISRRLRKPYPRPSYASQYEYAHVMRIGRFKLRAGPRGSLRFYDLDDRPREKKDAGAAFPVERRYLIDSLQLFLVHRWSWKKTTWGDPNNLGPRASAALSGTR